jgi:hypothetical protein
MIVHTRQQVYSQYLGSTTGGSAGSFEASLQHSIIHSYEQVSNYILGRNHAEHLTEPVMPGCSSVGSTSKAFS